MNIDQKQIEAMLRLLVEAYPKSVENWEEMDEIGGTTSLIAHLVYLKDHGYIEGEFKFTGKTTEEQWFIDFTSIRINAKGLDYAANQVDQTSGMLVRRK